MHSPSNEFLKQCLANMQAYVTWVDLTRVSRGWGRLNFVPELHKFYYIKDGEGWFEIGGRVFKPRAGQMFLLPAGIRQSLTTIGPDTYLKYWCHFTATIGDLNPFDVMKLPYMIEVDDASSDTLELLFRELIAQARKRELASVLKVKSIFFDLLHFYVERANISEILTDAPLTYEKMRAVAAYMNEHMTSKLSTDMLARMFHLSPDYFARQFKAMLGVSPIQYLNRVRICQARQQLMNTSLAVTEIAAAVGLELHYFSRLFKSMEGMSPKEYRQLYGRRK